MQSHFYDLSKGTQTMSRETRSSMSTLPSTTTARRLPRTRSKLSGPDGTVSATAEELDRALHKFEQKKKKGTFVLKLSYQAVGVIFGDLGTSPLYTFPNVFSSEPKPQDVLGAVSIIFWTLTLIAIVKYCLIVMSLNDEGEGGIFAMYALLCKRIGIGQYEHSIQPDQQTGSNSKKPKPHSLADSLAGVVKRSRRFQKALLLLAVLGTSMTIGDGVMTAAASVMSAVSGLQIPSPSLSNDVIVGISVAVIVVVFCLQRLGSSRIGFLYSPILITWFLVNATIGVYNIIKWQPDVFKAISPHYAVRYFQSGSKGAWLSLGGCVLCITGSEAMFADMGHFSHKSILIVALGLVYPSVVLIYLGEAAYLMHNTQDFAQSYFKAIPKPIYWPCFVIATAGALIGSQSLITSTFSIVRQAMRLNCFPSVKVIHTGKKVEGQIYIPVVNWLLGALTLACLLIFRSNTAIGNGFGVAVVAVMCLTTLMASIVMLIVWCLNPLLPLLFWLVLTFVEGIFLSSVLYKVPHGGWFPLALAAGFFFLACLWYWGTSKLTAHMHHMACQQSMGESSGATAQTEAEANRPFTESVSRTTVLAAAHGKGLAIYQVQQPAGVPLGFIHLMRTMPVLHDATIFLNLHQIAIPNVAVADRFEVHQLKGRCVYEVTCHHGFRDTVSQDATFVQAMVRKICEDVRYRAMAARSSAVDIYDAKTKADWKQFCKQPGNQLPIQPSSQPDSALQPDVELGGSPPAPRVSSPVEIRDKDSQLETQATWREHVEQIMASAQASHQHASSTDDHAATAHVGQSAQSSFVEEEVKVLQEAAAAGAVSVEANISPQVSPGSNWVKKMFVEVMFSGLCSVAGGHLKEKSCAQVLEVRVPVYI